MPNFLFPPLDKKKKKKLSILWAAFSFLGECLSKSVQESYDYYPPRCSSPPADAASPLLPSPLLLVSSGCRCSSDPCQGLQVISGLESQGVELKFVGRRCLLWFW
ncbi:hypothetical protein ACOSQ3_001811 [Xanthoceras sorbifolium]